MYKKAEIIREVVDGTRRKQIYELGETGDFMSPVIYIMKPYGAILTIHGNDPFEKYINLEKVKPGIEIVRTCSSANTGVVFTDSNSTAVRIFCTPIEVIQLKKAFIQTAIDVLAKHGVRVMLSSHRPEANDLVFIKADKEKKFSGSVADLKNKFFSFFICFEFDADKVEGVYKLDTDKILRRGDIKNISDIVGGLREISADIKETVVEEIVYSLVRHMNWQI